MQFLRCVRDFERIHFDLSSQTEADGFLFQFGSVNWLPEPAFVVDVTRQLEMTDSGGEHEGYIQVALGFHFQMSDKLATVVDHSNWWFRGSATTFESWFRDVRHSQIWDILVGETPQAFEVTDSEV